MIRVAAAMSGGVDSSVAALLIKESGQPVVGLSMQLYDRSRDGGPAYGRCCSSRDLQDARAAADRIGIPYYVLNFEEEFKREVVEDFVSEYKSGRTPVPCVHCNSGPKFRHLLDRAAALGAGRVATGHYARLSDDPRTGRRRLLRARDLSKDQSYFLFTLTQQQLARALFPLGDLSKKEVRALAAARGLPNADKPESQDLCFVPDGRYADFIRRESGDAGGAGEIVDGKGRVLGRHSGLAGFTIGQRRGLGIASSRPLYVVGLDARRNRVTVGEDREQYRSVLLAAKACWVSIEEPRSPFTAIVRIRSSHAGAEARVEPLASARFRVVFREAQRAVTPGQAVVLYDGDVLLGGGFITEVPGQEDRRTPGAD